MRISRIGTVVGVGMVGMLIATGCSSTSETTADQPTVAATLPDGSEIAIPTPNIDAQGFPECQTEYAELFKKIVASPDSISPEESQRWADQAKQAGELAQKGDMDGAIDIICGTVDEMNDALAS